MNLRRIVVPQPVTFVDRLSGARVIDSSTGNPAQAETLKSFGLKTFLNDPRVAPRGLAAISRWMKVVDVFCERGDRAGSHIDLEEEDWGNVKEYVAMPHPDWVRVYPALLWVQLLPLQRAIVDAERVAAKIVPEEAALEPNRDAKTDVG